jgi:hypothetical protein
MCWGSWFGLPLKCWLLYPWNLVYSYFDDLPCYRAEAAAWEPHRAAQLQVSGPRDSAGCLPGTSNQHFFLLIYFLRSYKDACKTYQRHILIRLVRGEMDSLVSR